MVGGIAQGIMNLRSPPAYPTGESGMSGGWSQPTTVTYVNYPPGYNDNWMNDIIADSDSWGTQEEAKEEEQKEEQEDEQEDEEVEQLPPLAVLDNVAGMEEAIGGPRPPPRPRSRARAGYLEKAKEVGSKIRRTCVERKGGDGPAGRRLSQVPTEVCDDRPPPGSYTCRQQAEWGKCDEEWLVGGGYCARSCGRCEPRPLYLFLAAGQGLSSALAKGLEGSSREMPQAARSAGNGRRQALQAEGASPGSGADSDSQAFVVGYQGADGQSPQFSIGTLEGSDLLVSRAIGAVLNAFDISTPEEYCSEGRRSLAQAPASAGTAEGQNEEKSTAQALDEGLESVDFANLDFGITQTTWEDSSVVTDWNPDTLANTWPREEDDGSAQYLSQFADLTAKDKLYVNFNFLIRETQELMSEEGLQAEMETLFWVHGESSPDDYSWDVLASSYTRLFTQLREDLGRPDLPIIDFGAGGSDVLNTAKASAAQEVEHLEVVAFAVPSARSEGECDPATDLCDVVLRELQEVYGADACDPNTPEGAQTFEWFADCSAGAPLGFEAEDLCGEMLTEAYVKSLPGGADALTEAGLSDFPGQIERCADSEELAARSVDSWCWDDLSQPVTSRG